MGILKVFTSLDFQLFDTWSFSEISISLFIPAMLSCYFCLGLGFLRHYMPNEKLLISVHTTIYLYLQQERWLHKSIWWLGTRLDDQV